jgi:Uncharacterized protein, putative amidase
MAQNKGAAEKKSAGNDELSVSWLELTGPDFAKAVKKSEGVCILPMGVLEKHGPHMPLATDCIISDYVAKLAAEQEYAIVFPTYYVGQINEARHQPGTVAYSPELCMRMLEETCAEIARNGCKKIIIFSLHGGNNALVNLFCQNQLHSERDYIVYEVTSRDTPELKAEIKKRIKTYNGEHAGERETSELMAARPDLVKLDQAPTQDGKPMNRLPLDNLRPSIFWYADYPNHYAGDPTYANKELGEFCCGEEAKILAEKIRAVKKDTVGPALQAEFFEKAKHPVDTEQ